jgi:tetratricopeptide (TPR) repeat protein
MIHSIAAQSRVRSVKLLHHHLRASRESRLMSQPPFDLASAHKWFAVEFNNRAWDLVEKHDRTAEETAEMIQAAHAAALHWQVVGTPLNAQRAENLLATAYLKAGQAEAALVHAQRGLALGEQNGSAQSPFDRATTLAAAAKANNLAGNGAAALPLIMQALAEAETLAEDDRAVFDKLYGEG